MGDPKHIKKKLIRYQDLEVGNFLRKRNSISSGPAAVFLQELSAVNNSSEVKGRLMEALPRTMVFGSNFVDFGCTVC